MARSAHVYVRGTTDKFYEWLENCSRNVVPDGPPIWICGDCHVGNVGPVANAKGKVDIQIRDLDQTVIGNPAHDLIRLALSLATAARSSDLPGVTTAELMEQLMSGYEQGLKAADTIKAKEATQLPRPMRFVLKRALKRKWKELAAERIEDTSPQIPLGKRFWKISAKEREAIRQVFQTEDGRRLVTSLSYRDDDAEVSVADAAYWVKGCSSLGHLRYAVLLKVGDRRNRTLALMDIKEAGTAAAPRSKRAKMPRNNGERIVAGAKHISPFLGGRMMSAQVGSCSVFVRELLPQDLKLEMDHVDVKDAVAAAQCLAGVVGEAHGRQMDEASRANWCSELSRNRSKSLDAPSWLWRSVVELIAAHETAYLDHCRRYALDRQTGKAG